MRLFPLAFLALVAGCNVDPAANTNRVWRANEVIESIDALNGKTIKVGGYLGICEGYECGLFQDKQHIEEVNRWLASARSGKIKGEAPDWLGIGGFPDFDAQAKQFNHSYVLITARVSNQCRYHGKPTCTDRAEELVPLQIATWAPPGSPSDTKL